jgi:transcription-repair coupling factor (superfamily II helicase)
LYAKRLEEKGFAYSADTYLQEALEASFIYDETPDQIKIIEEVKADMERSVPMDRLICGDVGFGKTEIAVRAAFKAVSDNKQVALLCPTTVLAYQHYRTFTERMKDLPVTIDFLSRMRTTKEKNEILEKLKNGAIDIVIGTHRIVSKDVKFKDLGLLIIDEEQKFGVSVKEQLKRLRVNVDTLTLTATPIPRTLQFSLMGARDLSILSTPPPNRQPIITELHTFDKNLIRKAINYEVNRNGQVFFVHNHVDTLPKMQRLIKQLCPDVSVEIAHGRMKGTDIERIITDFISQKFDVLLTTTIIENGIDIPNANTIIINNAHKFGLSELHQLRGRVGRSARKAFCYLIAPPKTALNQNARRRLVAIENFVELGSGFNIAMQDLDIRGAGDILGAEQSGFINDIGYETFKRILEEAMLELRTTEYKHIFANQENNKTEEIKYVSDCQVNTDIDVGFTNYIKNSNERLKMYRQLDNIEKIEDLQDIENKLIDRFGKMPPEAKELLNLVHLRLLALRLGIEKIILKQQAFICYFVSDKESAFYDSKLFTERILGFVAQHGKGFELKEKNDKLLLRFNNVNTINYALSLLQKI